mmetsp:Transcript_20102/g.37851  ORF Transcript_20102/g.37851 Transcript_20102/m.37851 type:complete len:622 (-) Transcript_20102:1635-3500(-)
MDFSTVDRALSSLSRRHPPLSVEVIELSTQLSEAISSEGISGVDVGLVAPLSENESHARGILRLVELGSGDGEMTATTTNEDGETKDGENKPIARWEPLAVGLRLIVDYLQKRTGELPPPPPRTDGCGNDDDEDEGTGLGTGGGGVYAEGPRIPKIDRADPLGVVESINGGVGVTTTNNNNNESNGKKPPSSSTPPNANSPVFELMKALPSIVDAHVEHAEPRVRSLVAQVVGVYALYATSLLNWLGSCNISEEVGSNNCSNDEENNQLKQLKQSIYSAQTGRRAIHAAILLSLTSHLQMKEPSRTDNPSAASDGALDDTTGWRALETNLHALASYIDGCVGRSSSNASADDVFVGDGSGHNADKGSYVDEEIHLFQSPELGDDGGDDQFGWLLSGLEHCCVIHVNRHVRAASAAVLGVLVKACMRSSSRGGGDSHRHLLVDETSLFRSVLKNSLRSTLEDNWSQVRMAGSVLCRRFVQALLRIHRLDGKLNSEEGHDETDEDDESDDEHEELTLFESAVAPDLVPMLLPRMCLNRFYLAQGVKLYSQDTWKLVFGNNGMQQQRSDSPDELFSSEETEGGGGMGAVARCAAPLCRFYAKMCDADNHAVREVRLISNGSFWV